MKNLKFAIITFSTVDCTTRLKQRSIMLAMILSKKHRKFFPLIILIFILGLIYFLGNNIPEEKIRTFILSTGPIAPLAFIFLSLITYIIAPISGTPLIFAGFYLFGQKIVIYMGIAAFISSVTNFWIARKWGRRIVEKMIGGKNIHYVDKFTKNYGLLTLLLSRIFLKGIHDVISYAAGLTNLKFRNYMIVSTIGMIPGLAIWYTVASLVKDPILFTILTLVQILIFGSFFAIGSLILKKRKTNNNFK